MGETCSSPKYRSVRSAVASFTLPSMGENVGGESAFSVAAADGQLTITPPPPGFLEVRIIQGLREGGHGSADYKRLSARRVVPGCGAHAGRAGMHKAHLRLPSF